MVIVYIQSVVCKTWPTPLINTATDTLHLQESFSQNTLKVLMNFDLEESDSNEFSGNSFVTTCMLLMINMFANDLSIAVDYIDRTENASTIDIFINYDDDDKVYNKSLVSSAWPHYQNRYCFIYANSRKIPTYEILTTNLLQYNYFITVPFAISWVYHYLILHFR